MHTTKYRKKRLVEFFVGSGSTFYGSFPFTAEIHDEERQAVTLEIKHGCGEYDLWEIKKISELLAEMAKGIESRPAN